MESGHANLGTNPPDAHQTRSATRDTQDALPILLISIQSGWLLYGEALNEGRELFPSDEQFGLWVSGKLPHKERHERSAAMWAAANPVDYKATKRSNPRVRTVRGLHQGSLSDQ